MNQSEHREELIKYYEELGLFYFLSGKEERKIADLQASRTIVEGFFNGQEVVRT